MPQNVQMLQQTLYHDPKLPLFPCCASRLELSPNGLLFCDLLLWSCTVENLQKGSSACSHSAVEVGFGALDVIVQVVAERVDQINSLFPLLSSCVTREEHW